MGKIVYIGDEKHKYEIPDAPEHPIRITGDSGYEHTIPMSDLILFSDLDDPYWTREELPKIFTHYIPDETQLFADETVWDGNILESLNEVDTLQLFYLFDREMYRRRNGVHFRNGQDEIVYVTGHHYAFLEWIKPYGLNDKLLPKWRPRGYEYAEYREFQRDVFYLIDLVNDDPDKLGLYIAKPKKTGITQCLAAYYLNKATMTRMAHLGVMSKGSDAGAVNMLMVLHGYDGLPPIFQPTLKDRADREGNIFFGEPALKNVRTKLGKQRRQKMMEARPLNTRVWAAKTKAAGFDSPTMTDVWFDEFSKYYSENKQEPETVFNRNQETVKLQDIFNGRIWITQYPPETDDKGFIQGRKIYYDSKLSTIKPGERRTRTGLIVHYIPATLSYTSTFNKYGKCDEVEAHRRNQEERNKVRNDKKAYQSKVRQYSETERECWAFSGTGSVFDAFRVGELSTDLDERMRAAGRLFVDGRLEWRNKLWEAGAKNTRPMKQFCPVDFIPLTEDEIMEGVEGRLRLYEVLPQNEICMPLRMGRNEYGNLRPLPFFTRFGSADPTEYAAGDEVISGSKNANYTMNIPDIVLNARNKRVMTKIILSEYFFRADNPQEYYEDLVKEILFFGKRVIVEANKAWVATKLIQDGLGHYMIVKQKSTGMYVAWNEDLERRGDYSLFRTGKDELETIVSYIAQYIVKPATNDNDTPDYGATINSERLLDQIAKFKKENSNLYDLVMAFGICLICGEIMVSLSVVPHEPPEYSSDLINMVYNQLTA